jgi:hypothetical protein
MWRLGPWLLPLVALLTGCAHFEYDLVRPASLARHIGDKQAQVLHVDPLEYRMQSAEDRLVIKIYNPTDDTIQLLGRASSVVDPEGESHPLRDRTIAPGSFVKLILPPLAPEIEPVGPVIGVGVVGPYPYPYRRRFYRRAWGDPWGGVWYYPAYPEPAYYSVYDVNDPYYWDWDDEADVRLILVFQRGKGQFRQEFTFHRRKM